MKKQHITITIALLAVAVIIAVSVFLLTRPTVREWTGEDAAHNSVTTRGMFGMTQYGGNAVIAFADFMSARESVFCSRPQCRHNSRDCFAFDLVATYHANHFAIMGEHIFFTSASYDPTSEYRHIIDIFESTFTGGNLRSIARIESATPIRAWTSQMIGGYYILGIGNSVSNYPTLFYAVIDLRTGEMWEVYIDQLGYGNSVHFLGMADGKMFFAHTYTTIPFTDEMLINAIDWESQHYLQQYMRISIHVANFQSQNITDWHPNFTEYVGFYPDRMQILGFEITEHGVIVLTNTTTESGFITSYALHHLDTGEVLREFDFNNAFPRAYGDYMFLWFFYHYEVFCLLTNVARPIPELSERLPNNNWDRFRPMMMPTMDIVIFHEFNPYDATIQLRNLSHFVTMADLFNSGIREMRTVYHSPHWRTLN
ncbi:MAG: hypothetical protein FWB93_00030 [Oscillospiraceae bacterium]|nr:hypothetical protein [Oscillospiraceae bacterium]